MITAITKKNYAKSNITLLSLSLKTKTAIKPNIYYHQQQSTLMEDLKGEGSSP